MTQVSKWTFVAMIFCVFLFIAARWEAVHSTRSSSLPQSRQLPAGESSTGVIRSIPPISVDQLVEKVKHAYAKDAPEIVFEMHRLASDAPAAFAKAVPKLFPYLIAQSQFDEVESMALTMIRQKPENTAAVAKAEFYRAESFLARKQYEQALTAAKGYYNVAALRDFPAAVDIVARVLGQARVDTDRSAEARFRREQTYAVWTAVPTTRSTISQVGMGDGATETPPADRNEVLRTIISKTGDFDSDIKSLQMTKSGYSNLIGTGNLLLLSDRPAEAMECFIKACHSTRDDDAKIALSRESLGLFGQTGSIQNANAFVVQRRDGDLLSLPPGLADLDEDSLKRAAKEIPLGSPPASATKQPILENQRQAIERIGDSSTPEVRVFADLESSPAVKILKTSMTRYRLILDAQSLGWFVIRLEGAKGKILRFDIEKDNVPHMINWWSFNPLYTDAARLNDPGTYSAGAGSTATTRASNGLLLSSQSGQSWHWIENVWIEGNNTVSFVHRFNSDHVIVAMRVPHPPSYNEEFFKEIGKNSLVKIVEVGRSEQNRPLLLAQIPGTEDENGKRKPCVLIYAGEHADEQDGMWVAEGAIRFLLADSKEAAMLRSRVRLLIIPMLDPDASAVGHHFGIITSFFAKQKTFESVAYANWFESWVDQRNRLDMVLDFHAGMEADGTNFGCALAEGIGDRGQLSDWFYSLLARRLTAEGYVATPNISARGWSPDRLGGWLSRWFGPITLAPEVNSEAPNHLDLGRTQEIGEVLVKAIDEFLSSADGSQLLLDVDTVRQARTTRLGSPIKGSNIDAIDNELRDGQNIGSTVGLENSSPERFVP